MATSKPSSLKRYQDDPLMTYHLLCSLCNSLGAPRQSYIRIPNYVLTEVNLREEANPFTARNTQNDFKIL